MAETGQRGTVPRNFLVEAAPSKEGGAGEDAEVGDGEDQTESTIVSPSNNAKIISV